MARAEVIQRHKIADYLNVGTESSPSWALMGYGFTTLDEEPGAQTESSKYINEVSSSSSIVSYETVFPFAAHLIPDEEAVNTLYNVGRNHLTGSDAEFEYVRVELWDSQGDDVYAARKFTVAVEVSDVTGETKQELSGNLNAIGDPVDGTFDVTTLTFTEAA